MNEGIGNFLLESKNCVSRLDIFFPMSQSTNLSTDIPHFSSDFNLSPWWASFFFLHPSFLNLKCFSTAE